MIIEHHRGHEDIKRKAKERRILQSCSGACSSELPRPHMVNAILNHYSSGKISFVAPQKNLL